VKPLVKDFLTEITNHPEYKTIIPRRNLKPMKPWIDKMDLFFKTLKAGNQVKADKLLVETEKIFGILNLSASKLFISSRPAKSATRDR
jgi:hypothetical protein